MAPVALGASGEQIFAFRAWVGGAPAMVRVFATRVEWEPRDGRPHRSAPPRVAPARGRLATSAIAQVDRSRSALSTSRVTLAGHSGVDSRAVVVDAAHDDISVFYQLALELSGLPFPARKRLLDDAVIAVARRGEPVVGSLGDARAAGPASEESAAGGGSAADEHDLIGCLARLLAADLLTVEEFESKRRQVGDGLSAGEDC